MPQQEYRLRASLGESLQQLRQSNCLARAIELLKTMRRLMRTF